MAHISVGDVKSGAASSLAWPPAGALPVSKPLAVCTVGVHLELLKFVVVQGGEAVALVLLSNVHARFERDPLRDHYRLRVRIHAPHLARARLVLECNGHRTCQTCFALSGSFIFLMGFSDLPSGTALTSSVRADITITSRHMLASPQAIGSNEHWRQNLANAAASRVITKMKYK